MWLKHLFIREDSSNLSRASKSTKFKRNEKE